MAREGADGPSWAMEGSRCTMIRESVKRRASGWLLQDEAARIVAAASTQGRTLTADEDAQVLALMARVRGLEEEIHRLRKHHEESQAAGEDDGKPCRYSNLFCGWERRC